MCDGQQCFVLEFLRNHLLDELIMEDIDVGSGLINENNFAVFEEGPADTKKLLFASRKSIIADLAVQTTPTLNYALNVALLHYPPQLFVVVLAKYIQILPKSGIYKHWLLIYHCYLSSQIL